MHSESMRLTLTPLKSRPSKEPNLFARFSFELSFRVIMIIIMILIVIIIHNYNSDTMTRP